VSDRGKLEDSSRLLKAAIFDYGGVMSFSPLWRVQILAEAMEVPQDVFSKIIFGSTGENAINPWHEAECGRQALDSNFAKKMQERLTPYGAKFDLEVFVHWVAEAINEPDPEMVRVVNDLRENNYPVALLTNAVREFRPVIEKTIPIFELFDVIIDSSEVGMRKPDKGIYDLTAQRLGVPNLTCVMVDDLEINVNGAREAGMYGILFQDSKRTVLEIRECFDMVDFTTQEI
ncbi:uncharacterized protein METZ01_LOCUS282575, partial [marine metagenome]|tara:strand:- start:104 stop:796 length:693 start_codon:yes stop_codon:yes gene_type:complete